MPQTPQQADAWFVVMTNPQSEERAEKAIEATGFTAYRPACRKQVRHNRTKEPITKIVHLFPSYVFVRLPQQAPFGRIRKCNGVSSFLGVQGKPTPVPSRLMEWLEIAEVTGAMDDVRTEKALGRAEVAVGDAVVVNEDHRWLGGAKAQVVAVHGRREVTLMLEHLAGMRPVRDSADMLKPA
jgi:transcription antitermination factor NusG